MNPRISEIIRLNGTKFNFVFVIGILFFVSGDSTLFDTENPSKAMGIIALLLYAGDVWAFRYKVSLQLFRAKRGKPELNWRIRLVKFIIGTGFLMRLCYRIFLLTFFLLAIDQMYVAGGATWLARLVLVLGSLFELFLIFYSWIIPFDIDKDERKSIREFYARESSSGEERIQLKELVADIIIVLTAVFYTHLWWDMSNQAFIDWIDFNDTRGVSEIQTLLEVVILNLILCFLMLVPMRLAYWIGEATVARSVAQQQKMMWSLILASLSVTAPVFIHWLKVYFL